MLRVVLERSDDGGWTAAIPADADTLFSERDMKHITSALLFAYRKWKFARKVASAREAMERALRTQAAQRKDIETCLTTTTTVESVVAVAKPAPVPVAKPLAPRSNSKPTLPPRQPS